MRRSLLATLALACLLPALRARAQPEGESAEAEKPSVTIGGRLFVRQIATATSDPGDLSSWSGELDIQSARVEVKARWRRLRLVIEAELTERNLIRDAYLRLGAGHGVAVTAGQFKIPLSIVEMASAWRLPVVHRGLLNDTLVDELELAGRRPGAELSWRGRGRLRPSARAGVFQGRLEGALEDGFAQRVAGRFEVAPGDVTLGLSGEWRATQPRVAGPIERFWAAALGASWDTTFAGSHGARVWIEGLAGSSWMTVRDEEEVIFLSGRLIAAWRQGGIEAGDPYVEPFSMVSLLDPDSQVRADAAWEVVFGVNAGRWQRWRGQLQLGVRRVGDNAPLGLGRDGTALSDATTVVLQAGTSF
jgi:hypothetical protein